MTSISSSALTLPSNVAVDSTSSVLYNSLAVITSLTSKKLQSKTVQLNVPDTSTSVVISIFSV